MEREKSQEYWDLVFGKDLAEVDPDVADLITFEEERQANKLLLDRIRWTKGMSNAVSVDGKTRWSVDASPPLQGLKQTCVCTPAPKFSSTEYGFLDESGDVGRAEGSSYNLIIVVVVTDNPTRLRKVVAKTRKALNNR